MPSVPFFSQEETKQTKGTAVNLRGADRADNKVAGKKGFDQETYLYSIEL
jgi:hypothetical protein